MIYPMYTVRAEFLLQMTTIETHEVLKAGSWYKSLPVVSREWMERKWKLRSCLASYTEIAIWGFPKIRGTILGVPIIRTIVFWGLYWGPLILGNYHIDPFRHSL